MMAFFRNLFWVIFLASQCSACFQQSTVQTKSEGNTSKLDSLDTLLNLSVSVSVKPTYLIAEIDSLVKAINSQKKYLQKYKCLDMLRYGGSVYGLLTEDSSVVFLHSDFQGEMGGTELGVFLHDNHPIAVDRYYYEFHQKKDGYFDDNKKYAISKRTFYFPGDSIMIRKKEIFKQDEYDTDSIAIDKISANVDSLVTEFKIYFKNNK